MIHRSLGRAAVTILARLPPAHAEDDAGGAVKAMKTAQGDVPTDAEGMTLYTFDEDKAGPSTCYDECARKWPPPVAGKGAKAEGSVMLVMRKDGGRPWAHGGRPLYRWITDKAPGDATGDGFGGVWHVAKD